MSVRSTRLSPLQLVRFGTHLLILCGVLAVGGLASPGRAQSPAVPNLEIDSAAAAVMIDAARLQSEIEQMRQTWQVPGLAVAVVKDDEVAFIQGFGVREVGKPETVDEHTLFAIASNSKAFTAAAVAMLVDEGKLSWDDRVAEHLPWLELYDLHASHDLRVRDLLCHRSGLGTFSGDLLWWGTDYTAKEVLLRARHLKPVAPFRARYEYSNLMFMAAGEVVREVSRQPWDEFVRARIFEPLGMQRSATSVRDLVSLGNYATPHKTTADGNLPLAWLNWDSMAAGGGILSSVHDMSLWLRAQLRHGRSAGPLGASSQTKTDKPVEDVADRLWSADTAWEMWQAHTPIGVSRSQSERNPATHFRAYGLGWSLSDYHGRKLVGHGGGYDGMYSQVTLVPEENLGIVVLTASMTGISPAITNHILDRVIGLPPKDWSTEMRTRFLDSRRKFTERVEKTLTPAAADTHPSHPLQDFCGTYRSQLYGDARVELVDGQLQMRLLPNPRLVARLEHLHYDTFVIDWAEEFAWFDSGTAHFVADSRGRFRQLELDIPNDDLWFYELDLMRVDEPPVGEP